jgi:hypothetical protein
MVRRLLRVKVVAWALFLGFVAIFVPLAIFKSMLSLETADIIGMARAYILFGSAALIFVQIRINLGYNRRKAATEFIFGEVIQTLGPLEAQLLERLKKPNLHFSDGENLMAVVAGIENEEEKRSFQRLILDVFNFYERMAISILKGSLDEDICYDDRGFVLLNLHGWGESYISHLQSEVDRRAYTNLSILASRWQVRYLHQSQLIRDVERWYKMETERVSSLSWGRRRVAERRLEKRYKERVSDSEIVLQQDKH